MEALRAAYSDDYSDSDSDALPPRSIDSRQKSNTTEEEEDEEDRLPPPPLDLLNPSNSFDYLRKGQGNRIRSFPHVEGNYALHVFIPVHIPPMSRKGLAQFLKRLACVVPGLHVVDVDIPLDVILKDDQKLEQVALGREFHISLGRTVPIRVHQIDSVVTMLRQKLQFQKRYWIDFSKWAVFVNDDHTRSFVSMEVVAGGLAEITRQIHTVDEIYRLHNLPEFYKDPRPHISLAWALGDISNLLKRRVEEEHRYHSNECSSQKNALLLYIPARKVSVISHLFQSLAMDRRLINVAKAGDIAGLYALLGNDQYILDKIDKVPFVDTPLHCAVLEGKTPFAMEVARLKPSFTRKQNKDGFSPMHLASKMGHVVIVKKLLAFDSDLCLVKGREWLTPLHCAAIEGKVEVINELLSLDACPKSIVEDLTVHEETALHLAAKNGQLEACRVLLEWLKKLSKQGVLEWKVDNFKTAMAAAESREVKELLVCEVKVNEVETNVINANHTLGVESNATNTSHVDQTVIPIRNSRHVNEEEIPLHQSEPVKCNLFGMVLSLLFLPFKLVGKLLLRIRGLLNNLLKPFDTFCKGNIKENIEMRNALLVVGVLIATITFQAGLSPPGGVWQDNSAPEIQEIKNTNATVTTKVGNQHYAGKAVMGDRFDNFIIGNSIGFYASIILICIVTVGFPLQPLIIGTLWSMSSTYIEAISIISPRTITIGFFPQVFILLCVAYVLIPRLWGSS